MFSADGFVIAIAFYDLRNVVNVVMGRIRVVLE